MPVRTVNPGRVSSSPSEAAEKDNHCPERRLQIITGIPVTLKLN